MLGIDTTVGETLGYLSKLQTQVQQAPASFVRRATPQAVRFLRASVQPYQRKSVDMSESITDRYPASDTGEVITTGIGAKKINWLRKGTPSHIIQARTAKALRFIKGGVIFRKRILHPGTTPKPILDRGYQQTQAMLDREANTLLGAS